ncbi:MAG: hypothetical protein HOC70_04565 [Gammaproteobacteria bacterium]|nr:hypothetical protein [Gammaproteobacteria bacterium]MBT4492495.1 hypothetical protein [Gammaproteobacteria bacterium]MBT7369420.1 hypothetical protein [Gammaproteobacteria bacterium]
MDNTETVKTEITAEAYADLASQVGGEPTAKLSTYSSSSPILRSQIRHWGVMTGDMRPLFVDLDYAKASPWKTLVAPQGVLVHQERFDAEIDGLVGCKAVMSSVDIEWHQPIKLGDTMVPKTTITDVQEKPTDTSRAVTIVTDTAINNPDGKSIGTLHSTWECCERGSAEHKQLFGDRTEPHFYGEEDIDAIAEEYKTEQARGTDALTGDAVNVGDETPHVLKGPTTREGNMTSGTSRWFWGHAQGFELLEKAPELFFENENHAMEPVSGLESSHHRAQRWGGVPGVLELNNERVHWLVHTLMNWMGDAGFITRMSLSFPRCNIVGDVTRSYGKVTAKNVDGDRTIVDMDVWQVNQLGERITEGTAQVALPTA